MPPEYLSRAEADERFRELEASMNIMAVENATRDGKVDTLRTVLEDIKKAIADRTQMNIVIWVSVIGWLVTIGTTVFASAVKGTP